MTLFLAIVDVKELGEGGVDLTIGPLFFFFFLFLFFLLHLLAFLLVSSKT